MPAMPELTAHIRARPLELKRLKDEGHKIIGYIAGGYVPDELLWTSGAIPIGLIRGGDHEPVLASQACFFRFVDTFCRAQIGYRLLGEELVYQLPDLLIVPYTDRNMFGVGDSWQLYTDVEVFKLGVPRQHRADHAFEYYLEGLRSLKRRLEELTGAEIEDRRLREEIDISNRIRSLLEEISYTRKSERPPISGKEFIALNHATYYADRRTLMLALESIAEELKRREAPKPEGPRVMLTGSTLAMGDDKMVDLLDEAGATIVIEEFAEGLRHYWQKVEPDGDPLEALADRYLRQRTPPAFFHSCIQERFDFLLGLIREFSVDGVLWYSPMYRDSYDREGVLFQRVLEQEVGIPFLKLNSDYDLSETGPMRTRIETFIEIIRGAK